MITLLYHWCPLNPISQHGVRWKQKVGQLYGRLDRINHGQSHQSGKEDDMIVTMLQIEGAIGDKKDGLELE